MRRWGRPASLALLVLMCCGAHAQAPPPTAQPGDRTVTDAKGLASALADASVHTISMTGTVALSADVWPASGIEVRQRTVELRGGGPTPATLDFGTLVQAIIVAGDASLIISNTILRDAAGPRMNPHSPTLAAHNHAELVRSWPSLVALPGAQVSYLYTTNYFWSPPAQHQCDLFPSVVRQQYESAGVPNNSLIQTGDTSFFVSGTHAYQSSVTDITNGSTVGIMNILVNNVTLFCIPDPFLTLTDAPPPPSPASNSPTLPWWGILLVALGGALVLAALGYLTLVLAQRPASRRPAGKKGLGSHAFAAKLPQLDAGNGGAGAHNPALPNGKADTANEQAQDELEGQDLHEEADSASLAHYASSNAAPQSSRAAAEVDAAGRQQSVPGGHPSGQPSAQPSGRLSDTSWPIHTSGSGTPGNDHASRGTDDAKTMSLQSLPELLRIRSTELVGSLELGSAIGRGSYGKVFKGRWKGVTVAIKIVEHSKESLSDEPQLRESVLGTSINHPNVIATYKVRTIRINQASTTSPEKPSVDGSSPARDSPVAQDRATTSSSSHNRTGSRPALERESPGADLLETWMILEYCDRGNLDRAISHKAFMRDERPDLPMIVRCLMDIAAGMDYLHSLGILHGDLKSANVLLKTAAPTPSDPRGFICKLADFGLSRVLETHGTHVSTKTHGTLAYTAAEVLSEGRISRASDVFSFGMMMWELYCSKRLFEGHIATQVFFKVLIGYRPSIPEDMPEAYRSLMIAAWSATAAERPSFDEVLKRLGTVIPGLAENIGDPSAAVQDD